MRNLWLLPMRQVGRSVVVNGPVLVRGRGDIFVGDRVVFDCARFAIDLYAFEGAAIRIGDDVHIGPGVSIEATEYVEIGHGARLGAFVKILDNNLHGTTTDRNALPDAQPVLVGAGAKIGDRCVLLPGARVGADAIVLDDDVLTRKFPAGIVVGGLPARRVRDPN